MAATWTAVRIEVYHRLRMAYSYFITELYLDSSVNAARLSIALDVQIGDSVTTLVDDQIC